MNKKSVLYFLCTGNSCRSQMAEGFGRKYLGDTWDVRSAGIEAHGLNPLAVKVMDEEGIDITNHESNVIDQEVLTTAELVVTLCGDARDNCPRTPQSVRNEHWGFDDPAKAGGTDEEIWKEFKRVRDQIKSRILQFKNNGKVGS